jgi:hypothetical protein
MTEIRNSDTAQIAKTLIRKVLLDGENAKRKCGSWCMKKNGLHNTKELHGVLLVLSKPQNCITSQHNLACEIETEDYFLGLNPGYVEFSPWDFYQKFKEYGCEHESVDIFDAKYAYTYGERMLIPLSNLTKNMQLDKTSRQLIISLWDNKSDYKNKFVPCNIAIKFEVNRDKLDMHVINRSQDVCRGIFLDTFAYPMIQQIVAKNLEIPLGIYYHYIINAHIYENDVEFATRIIRDLRNQEPLEIDSKLTEKEAETMLEISELIFKKRKMQEAEFVAKKLPDFWYKWKQSQIIYAYSKYIKKDPMPTSLTCVGVIINENPRKM